MKRASTSLRVLAVTALTAMLMMCNIWSSLSNCETDAECTGTEICQLDVKRCVPRKANDVDSGATADAATEASSTDASVDSGRRCETLPWGKPTLVKGLENIPVVGGRLSPDELSMVLTRGDQIGVSNVLYTASRPTTNDAFTLDGPMPTPRHSGPP